MSSLKKYEYVLAIHDFGGISQAAEELGIAQPTLSKFLKKLECDLGVELFDRSVIPMKPTVAGEAYLECARRLLNEEKQLDKRLSEIKCNRSLVIRLGISPSRSPYVMPEILALFRKKHPTARIIIEERTTQELSERLSRGELDLIISINNGETEDFTDVELANEEILLAVPEPLMKYASNAKDILLSSPIISVGRTQAMWQIFQRISKRLSMPEPIVECQSIESGLALVKGGLGSMLIPSYIASHGGDKTGGVRFLELPEEYKERRRVSLFYRREQFLSAAERDLIVCIKEIIQ